MRRDRRRPHDPDPLLALGDLELGDARLLHELDQLFSLRRSIAYPPVVARWTGDPTMLRNTCSLNWYARALRVRLGPTETAARGRSRPSQADDRPERDIGEVRMPAKRFAGVHVRDMHLHERQRDPGQGIAQGHAGVGQAPRIDDDPGEPFGSGRLYAVDQFTLVIALEGLDRRTACTGGSREPGNHIGERFAPINGGLAGTEKIEVGSVEHQDASRPLGRAGLAGSSGGSSHIDTSHSEIMHHHASNLPSSAAKSRSSPPHLTTDPAAHAASPQAPPRSASQGVGRRYCRDRRGWQ